MGRRIVRVPLDFHTPLRKVWPGYLMPDNLQPAACDTCNGSGYSTEAKHLHDQWYGNAPFRPEDNGSTPLTPDSPAVRKFAERNVTRSPDYYGTGEHAIRREARRLADLWNGQWSHHLNEADVAALLAEERLVDLTHTWTRENGWQPTDPPVVPTPEQVNEWHILSLGHDGFNAGVCVKARCERDSLPYVCGSCAGEASVWRDSDHKAAYEAWEPTEPPMGDGWQLWETVSEGSPISPVFPTSEGLVSWMSDPERGRDWVPGEVAAKFVAEGWAPTGAVTSMDVVSGVEFVGTREDVSG
ncbi:hypothetical protein GCM10011608_10360 [Micromonospora sonchi]|uniref:Uncharacterized protein n=1 Tax=Micromonospora sonchi TaxID=1763543 RepID=A0A917TLA9_9ACTN|nr:hypothetical protein [Micromonospora sonchi]GGM27503.1 hypothetical protein GCM10011608_10360 [Micromonospora sonchi]